MVLEEQVVEVQQLQDQLTLEELFHLLLEQMEVQVHQIQLQVLM
tara:strand:- start:269 stop:400 length:132 start_codon:yes stop_codon:yes gene_type:complete